MTWTGPRSWPPGAGPRTAAPSVTGDRRLGFGDVPLICARELEIEGSMPRVVRMMAHVETDLPRADITHVYLHGAANLRRDLTRVREVPDEPAVTGD